ncbi:MAG TPA: hypothetical protein VFW98_14245 [Gemmatimonadaceae bacterium]|nr:hypothetical protein [Gemmatimonadaceae bacterium]
MANRKFIDREGRHWEVRERTRAEWLLEPILDNPSTPRRVKPPAYESDPFELTDQELSRLLEQSSGQPWPQGPPKKSPFLD